MNLDISRFLESLTGRHARLYTANVNDMATAELMGGRDSPARADAFTRLQEVIRETLGVAGVLGATLVLRTAARAIGETGDAFRAGYAMTLWKPARAEILRFADEPTQTILPRVGFAEALQDMVDRTPVTIRSAAERTAQAISQLYSEGGVVAFAKSADEAVTEKVQAVIAQAIGTGQTEIDAAGHMTAAVEEVRELTALWSESYARMVFRTNVNSAVTQGRRMQAQDPDIKAVTPAFQFVTAGPSVSAGGDTRDNHAAMNKVIMRVDNPLWDTYASPLGYSCRCQLRLLSVPQLRRMGKLDENGQVIESAIPSGAHPDPGFRKSA